mmetsp:Transcript_6770/g.3789  ORF Transcript_6770/g.3789 Transcript_6770/m.3789 type:complete len:133 (+) Transcript_6770:460-858(+)
MIMQSTLEGDIQMKFDLKGSLYQRQVLNYELEPIIPVSSDVAYKDIDFLNLVGTIQLEPQKCRLVRRQLESDVELLRATHIVDYSLLLGVTQEPSYSFGLIDFLVKFGIMKKLEYHAKKCMRQQNFSVVPPN